MYDALKRLRGQCATQFILDLRRNPGGEVRASVELASEFFPKNTVVFSTRGRKKEVDTTFVTKRDGEFTTAPLSGLVDGGSASAAEALAASLQDHDRALLLGRRTFGKALMQTVFFTPSGDVIWLTIGRVITPSGRFIQRRYHGLRSEEYRAFGGVAGAGEDTLETFHTDHGRPVRGGGGIAPPRTTSAACRSFWAGRSRLSFRHGDARSTPPPGRQIPVQGRSARHVPADAPVPAHRR